MHVHARAWHDVDNNHSNQYFAICVFFSLLFFQLLLLLLLLVFVVVFALSSQSCFPHFIHFYVSLSFLCYHMRLLFLLLFFFFFLRCFEQVFNDTTVMKYLCVGGQYIEWVFLWFWCDENKQLFKWIYSRAIIVMHSLCHMHELISFELTKSHHNVEFLST